MPVLGSTVQQLSQVGDRPTRQKQLSRRKAH